MRQKVFSASFNHVLFLHIVHLCVPSHLVHILKTFPSRTQSRNSGFLQNQGTTYFLAQALPTLCLCLLGNALYLVCVTVASSQTTLERYKIWCLYVCIKDLLAMCQLFRPSMALCLPEVPFSFLRAITCGVRNTKQHEVR